jgi:nitrite reductase (NO-forming)
MLAHSIDLHAARTPWSTSYRSIQPGERITFEWTAEHAGVFMYHCGTEPAIMHIADGMYGAVIVDPRRPRPPARELVIVQSEFYGSGHDTAAMLDGPPAVVAFDAGPNHACAFHVVGGLFQRVELDGNPANAMGVRQTVEIPPGGGAICEAVFDEPGRYMFMTHRFADATRGAMGMLEVA